MNLSKLSIKQLDKLAEDIGWELYKRKELDYKRRNVCPGCVEGYCGDEQNHYPCQRCGTTKKYFKLR